MSNTDLPLTFEEFKVRANNFHLHFVGGDPEEDFFTAIYQGKKYFRECAQHSPQEFGEMVLEIKTLYHTTPRPEKYWHSLYRAYKLMRPYAQNDSEMFT